MTTALVQLSPSRKELFIAGAGRGALSVFSRLGSGEIDAEIVVIDPDAEKAPALAATLDAQGRSARGMKARVEDALAAGSTSSVVVALMVDRPSSVAEAIRLCEAQRRAVLGYMLLALPRGEFYGLRLALTEDDSRAKQDAALLFDGLAAVTERTGARAVVGIDGRLRHEKLEPLFRHHFENHFRVNARKLLASEDPAAHPIELSDGLRARPLLVTSSRTRWSTPSELADVSKSGFRTPLARGSRFAIAEVGPDGLRIHPARLRADGAVSLRSYRMDSLDEIGGFETLGRRVENFDANVRAVERAMERDTLRATRPVRVTD